MLVSGPHDEPPLTLVRRPAGSGAEPSPDGSYVGVGPPPSDGRAATRVGDGDGEASDATLAAGSSDGHTNPV